MAGTRTSGHSQRIGHLFSFVNQATTEDHRLHTDSNCNPATEERPLDRQAEEHCLGGREIHHPSMCRCHCCSQYNINHMENFQQSRRTRKGATSRKASFPKPQSKQHSRSSICFADQREDYKGLQSCQTYRRNRNSVTISNKTQRLEAESKPGAMVDAGIVFLFFEGS